MSCLGGSFINMQSLTDVPFVADVYDESMDFWMETAERCKAILKSICDGIVDEFIPLNPLNHQMIRSVTCSIFIVLY